MASANDSRSQPRSSDNGAVNRPKVARTPNVMIAIRHPATTMTVGLRHQGGVGGMGGDGTTLSSVSEPLLIGWRRMTLPREYDSQACPLARALEVVGER